MKPIAMQKHTYLLPRRQVGLSLVELMISLTIGLILLTGITTLIVQQSSARDELEKASREIENGRYAMQLLHDDIQLAGFYGEYTPVSGVASSVPVDPCNVSLGNTASGWDMTPTVPVPIYGYVGGATDPTSSTTCGLTNYKPNTAILALRRTATPTAITAAAVAGTTYLQVSQCSTVATPFVFGTTALNTAGGGFPLMQKDCLTPTFIRQYMVNVYYISTCDICMPSSDNIPTLKMVQVGPTAAPVIIPLAEGIENIQFDYGIDSSNSGSPGTYCTQPDLPSATTCLVGPPLPPSPVAPNSNWLNVMAVRVNLLARNNDATIGYHDTKTYSLSGVSGMPPIGPFNDNYKRHAYNELVRAINPSGRRE